MKLWTAALLSTSLFVGGDKLTRPEAYLKPGNKIVFSFYDHRDSDASTLNHTLVIQKTQTVNGKTSIDAILTLVENGAPTYKWKQDYACDSLNFYAEAFNWSYPIIDDKSTVVTFEGDSLVYPLNMKVGDALPNAYSIKMEADAYGKERRRLDIKERKVEALDSLDLSFGKVAAYRIGCDCRYSSASKGEDADKFTETHRVTEWFSPKYGIVKRRYEFGRGQYTVTTMEKPGL